MTSEFQLSPEYQQLQEEARQVALEVEPFAAEADELSTVHDGVRAALGRSRLWELVVPADHGGRSAQIDPLAVAVVREVLMATSSHLDSLFALQGIGSYAITRGGSEQQRAEWLPRVARGDALAALALTEPVAGSDLKSVTTQVTDDHDGHLVLSGEKSFISNGGAAAFYSVLARDGDGHTMVLVPGDIAGLSTTATPEIIAPHVLAELTFDDVVLPLDAVLGIRGSGFQLVLATLSVFRVSVAGAALGVAQAALEEAARHAAEREQFGRPMARLGGIADLLGESAAELEAARLLTYRAGALAREDPVASLHVSSMAKLQASEVAGRIADRAVQIMGRWGLIRGSKIEKLYRQARPMRIYEGGSQVLRLGIARELVSEVTRSPASR
jgi:acyl-CoA dehydrogenase